MDEGIRILFLAADPSDLTRTRLAGEYQTIKEELRRGRDSHRFLLREEFSVKVEDMTRSLMDFHPHIVHFSGHGSTEGDLCFEDPSGRAKRIRLKDLEKLFALHARQVQCVVLNACYSARQAKSISKHISYVIGLKEIVAEPAAHCFSVGFYQALSSGSPIKTSFQHACALLAIYGLLDSVKPVLRVGPSTPKVVTAPEPSQAPDRSGQGEPPLPLDRGPPRAWFLLSLCVLTVVVALAFSKLKAGDETASHSVEERRIEMPFFVDIAPAQQPGQSEGDANANASIRILGVTLLPDRQLEVRGEVQAEPHSDLSALHVEVTLDGETQAGLIDTNTRTWKVFFAPDDSPVPGERLHLKAVLVSARSDDRDRNRNAFFVQPAGQPHDRDEPISSAF